MKYRHSNQLHCYFFFFFFFFFFFCEEMKNAIRSETFANFRRRIATAKFLLSRLKTFSNVILYPLPHTRSKKYLLNREKFKKKKKFTIEHKYNFLQFISLSLLYPFLFLSLLINYRKRCLNKTKFSRSSN